MTLMGKTVSIQDVFLLIEWFLAKYLIIDFSIEKKKTQVFKEIPKTFFLPQAQPKPNSFPFKVSTSLIVNIGIKLSNLEKNVHEDHIQFKQGIVHILADWADLTLNWWCSSVNQNGRKLIGCRLKKHHRKGKNNHSILTIWNSLKQIIVLNHFYKPENELFCNV